MKDWWLPLAGIAVGLGASFTGLGGGFLVVPLLIALGYTPQRAVGTSFVAILVVAASSVVGHERLHDVDWRAGLLLGAGGILGAQIGPRLMHNVSAPAFHKIFAAVLVGLAAWVYFKD